VLSFDRFRVASGSLRLQKSQRLVLTSSHQGVYPCIVLRWLLISEPYLQFAHQKDLVRISEILDNLLDCMNAGMLRPICVIHFPDFAFHQRLLGPCDICTVVRCHE
jgi:hypothetical protein